MFKKQSDHLLLTQVNIKNAAHLTPRQQHLNILNLPHRQWISGQQAARFFEHYQEHSPRLALNRL